jgi:hypothetical protein
LSKMVKIQQMTKVVKFCQKKIVEISEIVKN